MPLLHYFVAGRDVRVGVWEITEAESYFLEKLGITTDPDQELDAVHGSKRLEWLAVRTLTTILSGGTFKIKKDEWGKPHLEESGRTLSISHSGNKAAAILGTGLVGIDIQGRSRQLLRIAGRVIRADKIKNLDPNTELETLHVYWGAKEALYKAYGKRELDFREDIFVQPFEYNPLGGSTTGRVQKGAFAKDFDIYYQSIENYFLVYAMER